MKSFGANVVRLVIVAMIVGCAGLQKQAQAGERLNFNFPTDLGVPKFSKKFTIKPKEMYLTRLVLEGDSIDNWTEALEIVNTWRKNYPPTIDNAYQETFEGRIKQCPESAFSVISKDSSSILYEIKTVNCQPNPDENSLTRMLYGNSDVFVLIYTNKVKETSKERRDGWIKALSEAKIIVKN